MKGRQTIGAHLDCYGDIKRTKVDKNRVRLLVVLFVETMCEIRNTSDRNGLFFFLFFFNSNTLLGPVVWAWFTGSPRSN